MTGGVRDRRACPRTRRKGPTARPPQRPQQQQKLQQGAQQRAGTKNLRETNIELREENPKTSQENLINFCGARYWGTWWMRLCYLLGSFAREQPSSHVGVGEVFLSEGKLFYGRKLTMRR